ncbi:MFS general substrate transporter [Coccomyxa subellipsoidea C-169]|uniref:MFS general substrate transporter n=1 Tax=Coccomyxa subellipsoidea (strain C-169) TaxID=574566 RepID=I0YWR6_COCSC|nr:MFS general substrate transporter [Coccomyxa subellipsoidea C-169]EIE22835.1 MFS general substrate transporter [Coccomyxa subellipsoidea C-169]|eukprot:XP_005647379.1 MFS general substrate transporter [Coccomyxa subellipsoidea C-169]
MDSDAEEAVRFISPPPPSAGAQGEPTVDEKDFKSQRIRTVALINLAGMMERMDEQILPALYNALGKAFDASPTELGYLTLSRALVQACASPLGGVAGHYMNRIKVTAYGCLLWGCMTAGFGLCSSVPQGIFFWGMNGIGLALVIPSGQSLVADYYPAASRGSAFGALYLTSALGGMGGSFFATNLGELEIGGIPGWRLTFFIVAAVSLFIGVCNLLIGKDPVFDSPAKKSTKVVTMQKLMEQIWKMMSIPTFALIIVQGIVGSIPWTALVFFTLYLQLLGMTDFAASVLMSLFLGSTAVGGLLGGYVGDFAAQRWPHHGRIWACQFSVAIGIPFSLLILKGLPENGASHTAYLYGVVLVIFGCLKSWAGPCCNNPIFAEIVPAHMRNMVYAFDRCFEGALAACAAPLVGKLAERMFGFSGAATRSGDVNKDLERARALGSSLLVFLIVPWTLCLIFYSGAGSHYPCQ